MRSFRPSPAIRELAAQIAANMPKRTLGGGGAPIREVPISANNKRAIALAESMDARQRSINNPDAFPTRETRQQRRRARIRGPNGV